MENEEVLANQWHRIYQLSYNSQGNEFVEAESIRNRLFLLDRHKLHTGPYEDMFSKLCDDYGKIVDSEKGLDGYKNTLLADVSTSQNRSRFWKSELSENRCLEMPNVSRFFNQLKQLSVNCDEKLPSADQRKLKWVEDINPQPVHHSRLEPDEPPKVATHESHRFRQGAFPGKPSCTFASEPYRREINNCLSEPMPKKSKLEAEDKSFGGRVLAKSGYQNSGRNCRDVDEESGDDNSQEKRKEFVYNQSFKTAKQQLISDQKNNKAASSSSNQDQHSYGAVKKSLGTRRGPGSKFVPPVMNREESENDYQSKGSFELKSSSSTNENFSKDPRLQNIDPNMIERISNEIMDHGPPISWDDIAGLEFAKKTIKEIVVWPMLRPDIFTGLRGPPKGLLLFGPPGTGKTLIGKCIASQSQSTFFSISASSLTSKWVGEGEKMVRALFGVAKVHQPAVIFIDEIDSLLTQRSDTEHESSRRIKTEFLVQLDGTNTGDEDRILVVGATNRPQEIDEAARRRFVKRLYIPLPELSARKQIIRHLLKKQKHCLSEQDMEQVCLKTEGYSGADMANLCKEAALGPIRRLDFSDIESISAEQVQDIDAEDFMTALGQVKASVSDKDLNLYLDWNQRFGSWGI